jgi:6-phosphogluconolactonase
MNIYRPVVTEFETTQQLYIKAEELFVDRVLGAVGETGVGRVAFSGGKTPLPFYSRLSQNPVIDWEKIEIFQTDERYVPSNSPDSNQYQITQCLGHAAKEVRELNFFNTSLPIDMTVKDYAERLEALDGPYFDFSVLGVGEDGHIASLFPGGKYLKHQTSPVIETVAPREFKVAKRVSLTLESILNSHEILILLIGDNKKDILPELLEGELSASEFPAKFLLAHPNVKIYQCIS